MVERTNSFLNSAAYRRPGRPGVVAQVDVDQAADALFLGRKDVTVAAIIKTVGGSASTVGPMLKDWRRRLPDRLTRGAEAFERIPTPIAHIVEALVQCCREDARSTVRQDEKHGRDQLTHVQHEVQVRGHVLALREQELNDRLKRRDDTISMLEQRANDQALQIKTLQASKDSLQRRVDDLQAELQRTLTPRKAVRRSVSPSKKKPKQKRRSALVSRTSTRKSRKPSTKRPRGRRR